jgi:glutaredoxin-like protein
MNEWQRSQNADNITFLPDGNGAFTKGMGMLVDKEDLGFGQRSWRYSMIVRDGQVEKMFVEPQEPGDPYGVSDADTMLRYLAPEAVIPPSITVLSRQGCPHCARAKGLLRDAGLAFESLELNEQFTDRSLRALANATTLPQVFVDGEKIGGAEALAEWLGAKEARAA